MVNPAVAIVTDRTLMKRLYIMNKLIRPAIHGILDYIIVILLAVAPTLFNLTGLAVTFSYIFAVVHLLLTVFTRFSFGMVEAIPFALHGFIELVESLALIIIGIALLGENTNEMTFYILTGISIFIVWLLSRYRNISAEPSGASAES